MYLQVGSDTYGSVRKVGGTPVVTQFFVVNGLPLYPQRSFYLVELRQGELKGGPLVGGTREMQIVGLPLARIDRTSAVMAYVRALLAAMIVFGCIGPLFIGVTYLTGNLRPGDDTLPLLYFSFASMAVGIVGGLLTYCIPLTSRREHDIRLFCGEVLGLAADPACTFRVLAQELIPQASATRDHPAQKRALLIGELIATRAAIAGQVDVEQNESRTDELLDQIRHAARGD